MKNIKIILIAMAIALITVSAVSCGNDTNVTDDTTNDAVINEDIETTAAITEAPIDPATEQIKAYFEEMYKNYNNKDYDKYLSNYDYDDARKEELKASYAIMAEFSTATYELKEVKVLHRTENDELMVEVKYNLSTLMTGSENPSVTEEQTFYQLRAEGDTYKITTVSPGSSVAVID